MDDTRRPRLRLDSFQLARTMMRLRGRYAPLATSTVTDEEAAPAQNDAARANDAGGDDDFRPAA